MTHLAAECDDDEPHRRDAEPEHESDDCLCGAPAARYVPECESLLCHYCAECFYEANPGSRPSPLSANVPDGW